MRDETICPGRYGDMEDIGISKILISENEQRDTHSKT